MIFGSIPGLTAPPPRPSPFTIVTDAATWLADMATRLAAADSTDGRDMDDLTRRYRDALQRELVRVAGDKPDAGVEAWRTLALMSVRERLRPEILNLANIFAAVVPKMMQEAAAKWPRNPEEAASIAVAATYDAYASFTGRPLTTGNLSAYAARIVRNMCVDDYRATRREKIWDFTRHYDRRTHLGKEDNHHEHRVEMDERCRKFREGNEAHLSFEAFQALALLTGEAGRIASGRVEGLDSKQIGQALGMSADAVRQEETRVRAKAAELGFKSAKKPRGKRGG